MTVYVVVTGCYGDYGIDSIHRSMESAKIKVAEINSTVWGRSTEPSIEEWEVLDMERE